MRPTKTLAALATLLAVAFATLCPCSLYAAAQKDPTIKIGFAAPLTGMSGGYGKSVLNGVKLAIDEAQAQKILIDGKPAQFNLIVQDDQADPSIGVAVAKQFVDQNVRGVVGHFNSGTTLPASLIYAQAGIPEVTPTATNPDITARGLNNIFTVIPNDIQNIFNAATYTTSTMKVTRIAVLDDGTAFGQGEADEFAEIVKARGATIVMREYVNDDAVNFHTVLIKIKSTQPQLLFFGGLDIQAANVLRQMHELGMRNILFVCGGGVKGQQFIKLAGTKAAEGAMAWDYGLPPGTTQVGKRFAQHYQERFGTAGQSDAPSYAPFGYDAMWTIIKAMQAANSSQPNVYLHQILKTHFEGATGLISFNQDGLLKSGISTLYQVKNGQWEVIVIKHAF